MAAMLQLDETRIWRGLRNWLGGKTKHAGNGPCGFHLWFELQIAAVFLAKRSRQEECRVSKHHDDVGGDDDDDDDDDVFWIVMIWNPTALSKALDPFVAAFRRASPSFSPSTHGCLHNSPEAFFRRSVMKRYICAFLLRSTHFHGHPKACTSLSDISTCPTDSPHY